MALAISRKEGGVLHLGDRWIRVDKIIGAHHVVVIRDDGIYFDIVDDQTVEVVKGVFVGLGPQKQQDWAKLIIEAPKSIKIVRGELIESAGDVD